MTSHYSSGIKLDAHKHINAYIPPQFYFRMRCTAPMRSPLSTIFTLVIAYFSWCLIWRRVGRMTDGGGREQGCGDGWQLRVFMGWVDLVEDI